MKKSFSLAVVGLICTAAFVLAVPAFSFLPELTSGHVNQWSLSAFPIQWNLNPTAGSNITGSAGVTSVMTNSFATWIASPNTTLPVTQGATRP